MPMDKENVTLSPVIYIMGLKKVHIHDTFSNKRWNSTSLMQLPEPNTSAKCHLQLSLRTAIWVIHSAKIRPAIQPA